LIYTNGRAPKATKEELEQSRERFQSALREFGVVDIDDVERYRDSRQKKKTRHQYRTAFFDKRSGGFYVTQKGHVYHREELEAAKHLAMNGYQVIMQPEGDGTSGAVSLKISKRGGKTYPEGKIGDLWYEQYTPSKLSRNGVNAVYNGLSHAHEKSANIAVIYDAYKTLSSVDIKQGIENYKKREFSTPRTKFDKILVIAKLPKSRRWGVYEWTL
jgi:hypothetical protein